MSCWTILEINPTKDLKEIKKAYYRLLNINNLEKNSKEYTKVTNAYIKAMSLVNTSVKDMSKCLSNNSIEYTYENIKNYCNDSLDNKNYIDDFNNKLDYIYNNPSLRFNIDSWEELLNSYMSTDKEIMLSLENNLINYIYSHKYIPHQIYLLIDKYIKINERTTELYKSYPKIIIDTLLQEINNPVDLSYNYLSTINKDDIDKYLKLREIGFLHMNDKKSIDYLNKAYLIYSNDLDLLKLLGSFYLNKNDDISALRYFKEALEIESCDMYCLSNAGHLLVRSKQYSNAISILEKYISKSKKHLNLTALTDLAISYYYSYEYTKALDLFNLLYKLTPTNTSLKKYIKNINDKIPKTLSDKSFSVPSYTKYIKSKTTPLIKRLNEIYDDFILRIDIVNWNELLSYPIALDKDLYYYFEQIIIKFITNHKFIPNEVFVLFSNFFNWLNRKDELFYIYPNLNINVIYTELYNVIPLDYKHFKNISCQNLDKYLELRNLAFYSLNSNLNKTLEYLNNANVICSDDYELFRIYGDYYLTLGNLDLSQKYYSKALSFNNSNYYCIYRLGIINSKKRQYTKALSYLEQLSIAKKDFIFIHSEEFITEIALSYYYTKNLNAARKYFKKLKVINKNLNFIDIYLKNITYRLNGVNKKEINISVITNPDYSNEGILSKFLKHSKRKFSLLFT